MTTKIWPFTKITLVFALVSICTSVIAAEFRLNVAGTYRSLDIEGPIEAGDYERFYRIAKENQGQLNGVHIYSPGGDFMEAIKIGRALRSLELSSQVPMRGRDGRPICDAPLGSKPRDPSNCIAASAAFFIHIGATHRGGTYLSVHRPYYDRKKFGTLTQNEADAAYANLLEEARSYMSEMGLPKQIQDEVLSTPSDKQLLLDERTIRTYIWGDLPSRDEWRRAKCTPMTANDTQILEAIGSRLVSGQKLTPAESEELSRLQPLSDQQLSCQVKLIEESRLVAYERFFGVKPTDIANHNFAKWADASRYLGRSFDEISSEERFEPGAPMLGISILERKATATSPSISLMDFGNKRKIVSWVGITYERPSEKFRQALQAELTQKWGKPLSDGTAQAWETKNFRGKLTFDSSAKRPSITLVIEPPLK